MRYHFNGPSPNKAQVFIGMYFYPKPKADANLTLTQSEKDEITRLNKELSSTKAQLAQVQSEPIIIEKMLPSDIELVRAEVLNENRTKFSRVSTNKSTNFLLREPNHMFDSSFCRGFRVCP